MILQDLEGVYDRNSTLNKEKQRLELLCNKDKIRECIKQRQGYWKMGKGLRGRVHHEMELCPCKRSLPYDGDTFL